MGDLSGVDHVNVKPECDEWLKEFGPSLAQGKLPVGGCGVTSAGGLNAKYIIHSRGPIFEEIPDNDQKPKIFQNAIRMATYTIFDTAIRLNAQSIAMPPVAASPVDVVAKYQIMNVLEYCSVTDKLIYQDCDPGNFKHITLCINDPNAFQTYQTLFNQYANHYASQS